MDADDVAAEVDMIGAMYGDAARPAEVAGRHEVAVELDLGFVVKLVVPKGYPATARPQVDVTGGPNVVLRSALERHLQACVRDMAPEQPILAEVFAAAALEIAEIEEAIEAEAAAVEARKAEIAAMDTGSLEDDGSVVALLVAAGIFRGEAIADRKSKFVGYVAKVASLDDVRSVLATLRSVRRIASATHPCIYAYRFTDASGVTHIDCDDDGEHGAARKLVFLVEQLRVFGFIVVVTRWYGGILLGPDRFKHIAAVARDALVASGAAKDAA